MKPLTQSDRKALSPLMSARLWLIATLVVVLIYSLPMVRDAFSAADVIQDDARQHVFWMQRFLNPGLFPNDLIADYFQSVAPPGYKGLYWFAAKLDISPLLFHKLLPLPLMLLTAGLCFALTQQLVANPIAAPIAASVSALLLAQGLGLTDAIVSATPKAFIYPLLLGLLYTLARGWRWGTAAVIALQGLFYPQLVLISVVLLMVRLMDWRQLDWRRWQLAPRRHYTTAALGIAAAIAVLLPYALQSHGYGPTLTLAEARSLPEMTLPGSRARFFYDDPATYWLRGRSGLRLATVLTPVTNGLGLLLPFLLWRCRIPLLAHKQTREALALLLQLTVASFVMFFAAHLLLFRLHLPSRYTQHSLRVVLSLAAAIAIVALIDGGWRWAGRFWQRGLVLAMTAALAASVLLYPLWTGGPVTAYQVGQATALYGFLRQQPEDIVIASLSSEANNLPSFTGRSILVGSEYAIPYHTGYYQHIRDRARHLIAAHYSPDVEVLRQFVQDYRVTHWLIDGNAFKPRYRQNNLLLQMFPEFAAGAETRENPVLQRLIENDACVAFRHRQQVVLDMACLQAE